MRRRFVLLAAAVVAVIGLCNAFAWPTSFFGCSIDCLYSKTPAQIGPLYVNVFYDHVDLGLSALTNSYDVTVAYPNPQPTALAVATPVLYGPNGPNGPGWIP